jgi:Protein of unknown function (DUF3168)
MAASKQVLSDFQAILASCSGPAGNRIYGSQAPQGTPLPAIVWHVIISLSDYTHDGHALDETVVQLDIDGMTATECREVADAIREGISGKTIIQGQTDFEAIFHDDLEQTSVEESLVPGTTQAHRLSVDYRLLHRPAAATLT